MGLFEFEKCQDDGEMLRWTVEGKVKKRSKAKYIEGILNRVSARVKMDGGDCPEAQNALSNPRKLHVRRDR